MAVAAQRALRVAAQDRQGTDIGAAAADAVLHAISRAPVCMHAIVSASSLSWASASASSLRTSLRSWLVGMRPSAISVGVLSVLYSTRGLPAASSCELEVPPTPRPRGSPMAICAGRRAGGCMQCGRRKQAHTRAAAAAAEWTRTPCSLAQFGATTGHAWQLPADQCKEAGGQGKDAAGLPLGRSRLPRRES